MPDTTDPLVLDLVEWIAREPRLYSEVIETWRTSCPRLTIWEDAVDRGYVARQCVGVGDVPLHQPRAVAEVLPPPGAEVVDHRDLVAARDEGVDEVRADEPRSAGDDRTHGRVS